MGIISQVYITETKKLFIVPFLCFSAWCQEDSVCFPSLTCEKQKLVQTVVPRADPCGMSLQLPCVATGTTPTVSCCLCTLTHTCTQRDAVWRGKLCVSTAHPCSEDSSLWQWNNSELSHCYWPTQEMRQGGRGSTYWDSSREEAKKQFMKDGESESAQVCKRGLDDMCSQRTLKLLCIKASSNDVQASIPNCIFIGQFSTSWWPYIQYQQGRKWSASYCKLQGGKWGCGRQGAGWMGV